MFDIRSFYIVDDHPLMRDSIRLAIQGLSAENKILGECSDFETACADIPKTKPQFVILDHKLNGKSGLDILKELHPKTKDVKYLLLTQIHQVEILTQYQELGIHGILLKESSAQELQKAITEIARGNSYMCSATQEILRQPRPSAELTHREIEVIVLMTQGKSNKEIGHELGCSDHTIKTHKANLMRKIELYNTVDVCLWAVRNGLV